MKHVVDVIGALPAPVQYLLFVLAVFAVLGIASALASWLSAPGTLADARRDWTRASDATRPVDGSLLAAGGGLTRADR